MKDNPFFPTTFYETYKCLNGDVLRVTFKYLLFKHMSVAGSGDGTFPSNIHVHNTAWSKTLCAIIAVPIKVCVTSACWRTHTYMHICKCFCSRSVTLSERVGATALENPCLCPFFFYLLATFKGIFTSRHETLSLSLGFLPSSWL